MSRIPRLTAEQRADLVAYLDGELGEDETRSIEQTLSASEVARHEVEILSRTWDLLDALPMESASAEFTAKTLASIEATAAPQQISWEPQVRRGLIVLGWTTGLVAAALIGFALGNEWLPRWDEPYVRELPLLDRLDAYEDVGSVDFLQELHRSGLKLAPPEETR